MKNPTIPSKPHALCVPLPVQSHVNSMLKLAKILHSKNFHITFVNTEFNHQKLLLSRGPNSLNGLPDFQFETIPDGLPESDINGTQDLVSVMDSSTKTGLIGVRNLITKLNGNSNLPPVSCIVSDNVMVCTTGAAHKFGIPQILFWPMSASVLMCHLHSKLIAEKGLFPLKDKSYLDMHVDFIPGLKGMRLRHLPSFFWDGNEELNTIVNREIQKSFTASAVILNTFEALESEVLGAMKSLLPAIYTIGPLHFYEQEITNNEVRSFGSNLFIEDDECLKWMDSKDVESVVYVNFGSITVMSHEELIEFAWGLANCGYPFLWIIRSDSVYDKEGVLLPPEIIEKIGNRGMISGWCPQEKVLSHLSTAAFLTHSGWNSTMDAMCNGIPIISWPFFGDQQNNCWNSCVHWGIGMELIKKVRREDVEGLVKELMEGEHGRKAKKRAEEWKKIAQVSTKPGGSSYANLEKVMNDVMIHM